MNVSTRKEMERAIVQQVVASALAAGYALSVNNGGDEPEISPTTDQKLVMDTLFATDDEHLLFIKDGREVGWVYFVYGNDGWDVINDYTTNLESVLEQADALADQYADQV
jgi:hypothetical protein